MAQFIKLTGGLKDDFIDKNWNMCTHFTIEVICNSIKMGVPSYWSLFESEQIFLSIFYAPLVLIPQGEQKVYHHHIENPDFACPMHSNWGKTRASTHYFDSKIDLGGRTGPFFEMTHLLKPFLAPKMKFKHEVFSRKWGPLIPPFVL